MYRKDSGGWLKHIDFMILDMLCLQLAYVLAYGISGYGFNPYAAILYRNMAVFLELADLIVIFAYGTMKNVLKRGYYRDFVVTLYHSVMVGALAVFYLFLLQQGQLFSRLTLLLTIAIYLVLTYLIRELWKSILRKKMADGGRRKLLIVTSERVAARVVANMKKNNYARYTLVGVVVVDADWTGVTVHLNLARITNVLGKKQFVEKIGNYTVLTTSMNYASSRELILKRLMDIAGGLVGCILTGLICLFVGPAIYLASPGPIFFSQERMGKNGKKFKIYKFRSMYMDAEQRKAELMKDNKMADGKMFKLDFDPRVIGNKILPDGTHKTGIGDFIRRTSLDEFPQFFNVLKGNMSIIGTRPPLLSETSLYELHHRARLAIKPGITGMWQVNGRSDITDFEEVVRLDKEYIENWNIGMDVKILLKTVMVVLGRRGSA